MIVPRDCVASNREADNLAALEQMELVLKADTKPADEWTIEALRAAAHRGTSP